MADRRWRLEHSIRVGPPNSIFNFYPFLFRDMFPEVDLDRLEALSISCRLLASSVVAADDLIDDENDENAAHTLLRCQILLLESLVSFSASGASASFLANLRDLFSDYAQAAADQMLYSGRGWRLRDLTLADGIRIARGKTCLALAGPMSLDDVRPILRTDFALLESAVSAFNLARQFYDDLSDWRADLKAARPSLIVAILAETHGESVDHEEWRTSREPALSIYHNGILERVFEAIDSCLTQVDVMAVAEKCAGFQAVVAALAQSAKSLRNDLFVIRKRRSLQMSEGA